MTDSGEDNKDNIAKNIRKKRRSSANTPCPGPLLTRDNYEEIEEKPDTGDIVLYKDKVYYFRANGNTCYLFLNWDDIFDSEFKIKANKTSNVNAVIKLHKLPEEEEIKNKTQVNSEDDSGEYDVKQLQKLFDKSSLNECHHITTN